MPTRPKTFNPRPVSGRPLPDRAVMERKKFYNSTPWKRLRAAFLRAHPLCVDCEAEGRLAPATTPHHVKERLHRPDLALDESNLVALCGSHHTLRHKAREARP